MKAFVINQLVQYPVAFLFGLMLVVQIMYCTNGTPVDKVGNIKTYIIYPCTYIYIYRLVDRQTDKKERYSDR